eukprot:GEMP01103830.1.p2 GENE.GEMP01103830.1~~GEMP01103830.1.p2  ORF type:complete len:105 (-),score=4.69 GEMP01103830.1:8-322(-)
MGSPLQTLLELHSTQKFLGYKQYGLGSLQPMCRALMVMHSTHMFPRVQNPSPLLDRQANDKLHIAPPGHLTPNSTVLQSIGETARDRKTVIKTANFMMRVCLYK